MKVLFISSWYPNSTNPLKGVFVKKHAAAIKSAGIDIEVLAIIVSYSTKFFERRESKTTDENGVTTHTIELNSRFYKIIHVDLLLQFNFLKKYFYKKIEPVFKPDLIHSNVLFPAAIMGYWLSGKEKIPHVITEHWSKVDNFFSKSVYSKSGRKAYNSAAFVTVVSEFLRKSVSKHFDNPETIKVVPNVVDTNVFKYKAKSIADKIIFCCVAHWTGGKRPDLLFDALEKFAKSTQKPVVLNVIGEGDLIEELKQKKWNFEVNYLGNLFKQEMAEKLQEANFFLHASNMETFSIVIAEALATGTPVLASNVGAIPELINKENGLLCENKIESWHEGINELIKTNFEHKKIAELAQNYDSKKIGIKFSELYKKI